MDTTKSNGASHRCFVPFSTFGVLALWLTASLVFPQGTAALGAGGTIDLTAATLVVPSGMSGPELKAADMVLVEVQKRCFLRWPFNPEKARSGRGPTIFLGQRNQLLDSFPELDTSLSIQGATAPEGYQLLTLESGDVVVAGNDARGVLFGAGKLLRTLSYGRETVSIPRGVDVSSAPHHKIRGHQFSYRPKVNSYDGWTVDMWEQYLRDIVVYGANAIEIIPPRSDDADDSPHFNLSKMSMMVELSRLAKDYGIELWIWYPALDDDYSDAETVNFALKEWGDVLRRLPRVDALFVPGGDPGHTPPNLFFPLLEKQARQLRKFHPEAEVWMSPQGFDARWMDDFYALMGEEPEWLDGVCFGPQQRVSVEELRSNLPDRYPIRFYPDITHNLSSQYPVPEWDFAHQATINRESINPRPIDHTTIFQRYHSEMDGGIITYSEGCSDDLNKCIWSSLSWNPEADITEILRDYSRYFVGADLAEGFAQGLLALERNWRGPLATNEGVAVTLRQFQELERVASPAQLRNWRFQQALYRAYYDATVQARLRAEIVQEDAALEELRRAGAIGSGQAMDNAERLLASPDVPVANELRSRTFELAEALFQSISMQLSVERYRAISVGRGANLDLIDYPLNNADWLRQRFAAIRELESEEHRLQAINAILDWENPGPGGFYDNLGVVTAQPHLVKGLAYAEDPAFLLSPHMASTLRTTGRALRVSTRVYAESRDDTPLEMHYENLDPNGRYRLRVIYGAGQLTIIGEPMRMRLVANDRYEIHGMQPKDPDSRPLEFDIPPEATNGGELRLSWTRPTGLGGNGRGVQVAEVWLEYLGNRDEG